MVTFILNNETVSTSAPEGSPLVDFIRNERGLTGTKTGCREGDCGACTVLAGEFVGGKMRYKSIVSCLTPLANVRNRHIVTIEGLDDSPLTPLHSAIVSRSATQCGFCTPGIIMSLAAFALSDQDATSERAVDALSGNICRCTGYLSLAAAAEDVALLLKDKDTGDPVRWLVEKGFFPDYFLTIPGRLEALAPIPIPERGDLIIGGATDLMVRQAGKVETSALKPSGKDIKAGIEFSGNICSIPAYTTLNELVESVRLKRLIPELESYMRLVASESVRNMATVAGNIANASPIGDMTIMFLALDSRLKIESLRGERNVELKNFFRAYKETDLGEGEMITGVSFNFDREPLLFSFEKVSRRTHLDIASVNSALTVNVNGNIITECHLSAGGVSPVPLYLSNTSSFLLRKPVTMETIMEADRVMQEEISPISDVRGSSAYKRLLLRQLLVAHFIRLFPGRGDISIKAL